MLAIPITARISTRKSESELRAAIAACFKAIEPRFDVESLSLRPSGTSRHPVVEVRLRQIDEDWIVTVSHEEPTDNWEGLKFVWALLFFPLGIFVSWWLAAALLVLIGFRVYRWSRLSPLSTAQIEQCLKRVKYEFTPPSTALSTRDLPGQSSA